MTAKDWFGVVVRVFGLFGLYYGLYALMSALYAVINPRPHTAFPSWWVFSGIAYTVVGVYLVRGAPLLLRFAYPAPPATVPSLVPPLPEQARNPWDANS